MSKFKVSLTVEVLVDSELTNIEEISDNISIDVYSEDFSQVGIVDSNITDINLCE